MFVLGSVDIGFDSRLNGYFLGSVDSLNDAFGPFTVSTEYGVKCPLGGAADNLKIAHVCLT